MAGADDAGADFDGAYSQPYPPADSTAHTCSHSAGCVVTPEQIAVDYNEQPEPHDKCEYRDYIHQKI
jgi:hypothetical protein